MTEFDWKRLSEPAAVIQALQAHRLLPVAGLLAERGLVRGDLVALAGKLAGRDAEKERGRAAVEDEVLDALGVAGIEVLVLKGALSSGIGSLVAAGMRLSVERFETQVDPDWLGQLDQASKRESAQRLTRPPRSRALEIFRSAYEEKGLVAGLRNLRGAFFPPAAYMRRKYPGAGWWVLPWLYVRRVLEGFRK
jgi:hypothetical protein